MLIVFSVNDQKISHDLKQSLVAGSSGVVIASFLFDESWNDLDIAVVFSNSAVCKPEPVRYDNAPVVVPSSVLVPGKLYVSCIGFGDNGYRKTTQAWDIQQAITVMKCGALGDCELLRPVSQSVSDKDIAADDEIKDMLDQVFGEKDTPTPPQPDTPAGDEDIATDDEVKDMLDNIFGGD